ncbi:hypothetical protein FMM49_16160 [Streptomyces rimosus subsp. rimosus]|nr:hypothetical protein CTZ40_15630 [Streptomyces rimosus]QEV76255.1 hypothetical protein CP984_15605 [Streptomyces rimosus]QTL87075.1 hypothetical protein FMM49_16160 [Streptomyces rimosus subsp. rimosus]
MAYAAGAASRAAGAMAAVAETAARARRSFIVKTSRDRSAMSTARVRETGRRGGARDGRAIADTDRP